MKWHSRDIVYRVRRRTTMMIGELFGNRIDVFWFTKEKNAGDLLTPLLLRHYGLTPVHSYPEQAEAFVCGSILEKVPPHFEGFILGTGFMHAESVKALSEAVIFAVRGKLSRAKIEGGEEILVGDPGLLIPRLCSCQKRGEFKLGIIPHYVDKHHPLIESLYQRYKKSALLIDVQLLVARDIARCEMIISSSLHGLVFADALGIPNVWIVVSDKVSGKGFKFRDYNSALDKQQECVRLRGEEDILYLRQYAQVALPEVVREVTEGLEEAFMQLRKAVLAQRKKRRLIAL